MIGIISALGSESVLLSSRLTDAREEKHAGALYRIGKIDGVEVVLVVCGVGKVNAAMHAQAMMDFYHPEAVLQSGVAGSLSPSLDIYDLVIGDKLSYHDMQDFVIERFGPLEKEYFSDAPLVKIAKETTNGVVGKIASGDLFVSDKETKRDIAERTQALCVEMEGAAVAHTAHLNEVPFLALRVISDSADVALEVAFDVFEKAAAKKSAEIVLAMLPKISRALSERKKK
ncbi:MAG: 5'-methylthioadenosine/adenosylhomocysteine nucleosidase [Clostridia bacterium]|nr:5'-methylthioadenosine/adenosylhomocysteine nucleosidase [Clostridia bacterium]